MTRSIRTGIIGFGKAGSLIHSSLISSTPGLELVAVSTSSPERQAKARAAHPSVTVHGSSEALLSDSSVELVVIASPNRTHAPLAIAALEKGKAVVVDKPFAVTGAQAREVISAAARTGAPLTVFQNRRWDGDFLTAGKLVSEGRLGRVLRFETRYEEDKPLRGGWRERGEADEGGGLLYDLAAHLLDQVRVLFGPVSLVHAEVRCSRKGAVIDDDDFLALSCPNGVTAHVWVSAVPALPGARFRVIGTEGVYEKHGLDIQEEQLAAGLRPGHPQYGHEPQERWGTLVSTGGRAERIETEPGCYHAFYLQVAAALRGEGPLPVEPADALACLELIEQARSAATTY